MTGTILVALISYAVCVLGLGILSTRRSSRSTEEYFLAGRTLGTLVLFMALFGTNCTAFLLVGIPGNAYHDGIGVFSVNAPIISLGIPLTFWAIGVPALRRARVLGALTPAELYAKQLDSRAVGILLFSMYTIYTIPYMVTAVNGAALTFAAATGIDDWKAATAVLTVALVYTACGGMRGTAWTNVLQGTIFMTFMSVALILIAKQLGGFANAMQQVPMEQLTIRTGKFFAPGAWTSWGLAITLTVIGFPHMLARLMAARNEDAIKNSCRLYPLAMVVLWIPAVLLGVWGRTQFPGLEGKDSDQIYSLMIAEFLPEWLVAVGLLAVLAAVMSTLDAQILTLSSMLVRDALPVLRARFPRHDSDQPAKRLTLYDGVNAGRAFSVLVAVAVFALAMTWGKSESIVGIAQFSFSGYVTLTPTLLLGLRWSRFCKQAAFASILGSNAVLIWLTSTGTNPGGLLPVFWSLLVAVALGLSVSVFSGQRRAAMT